MQGETPAASGASNAMIGTEGALARMTLRLSKPSERSVTGGRWTQNRVFATLPLVVFLALGALAAGADKPAAASTSQDSPAPPPQVNIETRKKADKDLKVESRPADIKVTSTLVLINVTVTDPLNRFVTGLERDNFRLFEDKKEQSISAFSSEDAPISIGLVFDTSGSMGAKSARSHGKLQRIFSKPLILMMNSFWCGLTTARSLRSGSRRIRIKFNRH